MRVLGVVVAAVALVLCATPPAAAEGGWEWPVQGPVLTPYSNDNARPYAGGMHRGIDIGAGEGTVVTAARAGTVTHAGVVGSSGLTVAVRTADGRHVTSYLHLSTIAVSKGDAVSAGTRVGAVGTSGRRSVAAPHLHFGVRIAEPDEHYVDPLSLLPALPGPAAAPAMPIPAAAPLRAEPRPVPVPVPATAVPRAAHRASPAPAPGRTRPHGTLQPGPSVAARPVPMATPAGSRRAPRPQPQRVSNGPRPIPFPDAAPARAPVAPALPAAAPGADRGRPLVLAGLGLIALVLFGGVAGRGLARANAGINMRAAGAATSIRDVARIRLLVRRLLSP